MIVNHPLRNDRSCSFSTSSSLLIEKPLSTETWPWESVKTNLKIFQRFLQLVHSGFIPAKKECTGSFFRSNVRKVSFSSVCTLFNNESKSFLARSAALGEIQCPPYNLSTSFQKPSLHFSLQRIICEGDNEAA